MQANIIATLNLALGLVLKSHVIDFLSNLSGTLQNLWWLVCVVLITTIYIIRVVFFRKKTHMVTKNTITELKRNKKYIPKLFVELNEGKETLRYFIYGTKWKKRITEEFNNIYDNTYGDILKQAVKKDDRCFHMKKRIKLAEMLELLKRKREIHDSLRTRKYDFIEEYSESQALFEISCYPYIETLSRLVGYTKSAMSRYLILTGSAGNGKTNLLCSISELLMALNEAVVFVTAREIDDSIEEYILEHLEMPSIFKNHWKLYWKIENLLLLLQRKHFYIVIDAVNESEKETFSEELASFVNEMLEYTRFKVIVSCRNEYYEVRFRENLVGKVKTPAFELDIKNGKYSEAALDRIIDVYRKLFNFTGNISEAVKTVLCEQLLLLRIFFETNVNSKKDVLTICKHEIFKEYIKNVGKQISIDTDKVLRSIAKIMINTNQFDGVKVSDLVSSSLNVDSVKRTIDESILISKKIVVNKGTIAEIEHEMIYFVFDELRDYILAREILISNSDANGVVESKAVIRQILKLQTSGSSAFEGTLHYSYVFFRDSENSCKELCSSLLDLVRIPDDRNPHSYFGMQHRVVFQNLGLRIILTSGLKLTDFEKDYIRDCLTKDPYEDGGIVFDVMLKGTIYGGVYDLDTYLDILFGIHDTNRMLAAFKTMNVRNSLDRYYLPKNLKDIHKKLSKKNNFAALQVQQIAELFLIYFKLTDPNEQYLFEQYFCNLPNHKNVCRKMLDRIKESSRRGKADEE